MLRAPETGLSGADRPRRGGGVHWTLGTGGERATVCALAYFPGQGVQPDGVAATTDPAPGAAGAAITARAGEPGPEGGGAVPRAEQVVAGAVDLCPCGRRRADQQCGRARSAPGGAVAQGQLRLQQRGGESVCGTAPDGSSHLSAARTTVVGVLAGRWGGRGASQRTPLSTTSTIG